MLISTGWFKSKTIREMNGLTWNCAVRMRSTPASPTAYCRPCVRKVALMKSTTSRSGLLSTFVSTCTGPVASTETCRAPEATCGVIPVIWELTNTARSVSSNLAHAPSRANVACTGTNTSDPSSAGATGRDWGWPLTSAAVSFSQRTTVVRTRLVTTMERSVS